LSRRDKHLRLSREYARANADKRRNYESKRRALKANAPQGDPAEAAAYAEILREGICELCGAKGPIEIDHIDALSTGGEHGWENFAGLCKSCNSSKQDKSLLHHIIDLAS
jgi:5-methylcytosine-specific restriction endonuclease McrA